jgi:tRNA(adenine34) deaminase
MRLALEEARKAFRKGEVPIGAVAVSEGQVVGRGHNLVETLQDPTAHAEMLALTAASTALASWRLETVCLYSTLEPCPMCSGAILLSRVPCVVYGAKDPRYGACGSAIQVLNAEELDVHATVVSGVEEEACRALLQNFFHQLRQQRNR